MALFGKTTKGNKRAVPQTKTHTRRARAVPLARGMEHEVIRAPWFSEKTLIATEKGVYAFMVPPRATKADIAGAIKTIYNVEPRAVRIVNLPAKRKRMRTRQGFGVRSRRRKAYVYLNKGDSIQFA